MRRSIRGRALLVGACMLAGATAWAQQPHSGASPAIVSTDLAVTYAPERAELEPGNCGCSWLQGGSADAAVTFRRGLGIAASLTGDHASNFAPGVDVNKIAFMAGPRYTYTARAGHAATTDVRHLQLYGQGLFGGVHAFNGVFPASSGTTSSAGSFALQVGGGMNLFFSKSFGVRLLEMDYVRTALPNSASNTQNDLRLACGVLWHIGRH
jgi:outer membrane immunogenic protein